MPYADLTNPQSLNQYAYVGGNPASKVDPNGKERDSETGLDYFRARYYSNDLGRFVTPDPLVASTHVADPQSWNRYSYARNNPLRFGGKGLTDKQKQQF